MLSLVKIDKIIHSFFYPLSFGLKFTNLLDEKFTLNFCLDYFYLIFDVLYCKAQFEWFWKGKKTIQNGLEIGKILYFKNLLGFS